MKEQIHEDAIVQPDERIKLGSLRQSIAREAEYFDQLRDKTPAEPMRFECQWEA
jgi:hypothetical protein